MTTAASTLTFEGRRVLVTGAARGIGLGLARHFAGSGARLVMVDIDGEELTLRAAEIPGAEAHVADASDDEAMREIFARAPEPIEIIIANAGVSRPRVDAAELSMADWDRIIRHNLTSTFVTMRAGVSHLREHGVPGRIIATASVASVVAEPGYAAYAAAKWAVIGLVKSMAMETAADGILINAVCPGDVDTRFLHETVAPGAGSGPLGRPATIAEIVRWFDVIAGPAGAYLVGEAIVVDGGLSLQALT